MKSVCFILFLLVSMNLIASQQWVVGEVFTQTW
jgi:hypothetical protein